MMKWFSPSRYFDPTDYERWFENLALQGFHPQITPFSFIAMRFAKGDAQKYKYVVDVQAFPKGEYVSTYTSFGWELVGKMANMFIWRKAYEDKKPEAFSDRDSMAKRNARLAKAMTFSTVAAFLASILFWVGFAVTLPEENLSMTLSMGIFGGVLFLAGGGLLCLSISILRSKKAAYRRDVQA